MSKYGKWIGGGLGWAMGGPMGAFLGFIFGSFFDSAETETDTNTTHLGDFEASLMVLIASVMKADDKLLKSELNYVKQFLINHFGESKSKQYLLILRESIKHEIDLSAICLQIKSKMDYSSRIQLIHILIGIAYSDNEYHIEEKKIIGHIAHLLGLSTQEFYSCEAHYISSQANSFENDYLLLETDIDATNDELKSNYRKLVKTHHPDSVSHLGEDIRKQAEEKFKKIQMAYERIKKHRTM